VIIAIRQPGRQTPTGGHFIYSQKELNTTKLLFACQATNNCINYACSEIFLGVKILAENRRQGLEKCCQEGSTALWRQQQFIFDGGCRTNS
ncbi:hypothetical protein M5D96_011299, partial [Drosophila gunungcola]